MIEEVAFLCLEGLILYYLYRFYLSSPKSFGKKLSEAFKFEEVHKENQDAIEKSVRVREATYQALKKKKEKRTHNDENGLPPGQKLSKNWPVLDLGIRPDLDLDTWTFQFSGLKDGEKKISLKQLCNDLGTQEQTSDLHCVTSWTVMGLQWKGVSFKKLLDYIHPIDDWTWVMQYGADGYTVNIHREDALRDDVLIAFECNGQPLSKEHGIVRLVIPSLYGWKGSKYLVGFEFLNKEDPGFWEQRGSHARGRAQLEERWAETGDMEKLAEEDLSKILERKFAKRINLAGRKLTEIPKEIFEMEFLQELRLENNQLTRIPPEISKLKKLTRLVLSQNKIEELPAEIGQLPLSELYIINNSLTSVPKELGNCTDLVSLWFDNNKIESIPKELGKLTDLGALSFDNNCITTLPVELAELSSIRSLSFRKNPIKYLPPEYYKLTKLNEGWLGIDHVENVDDSITLQGTSVLLEELKRQYNKRLEVRE